MRSTRKQSTNLNPPLGPTSDDRYDRALPLLDNEEVEMLAPARNYSSRSASTATGSYIPPSLSLGAENNHSVTVAPSSYAQWEAQRYGMATPQPLNAAPLAPPVIVETPEYFSNVKEYVSELIVKANMLRPTETRSCLFIKLDKDTPAKMLLNKVRNAENVADIRLVLAEFLKTKDISPLSFGSLLLKEFVPLLKNYWKGAQVPHGEWQWNVSAVKEFVGERSAQELAEKLFFPKSLSPDFNKGAVETRRKSF